MASVLKEEKMRLIDADALTNDIIRRWNTNDDTDFANKEVWKALEEAPTIDAVPVVRCKNCKHRYITGSTTHYYVCDFMDAEYNDNGYCHHGEREDDDN